MLESVWFFGLHPRNQTLLECFDEIAGLEVLEVGQANTAFETFANFTHIILKATQRLDRALPDDGALTQESDFGATGNDTTSHHTARDRTDFGNLKDVTYFGFASDDFFVLRRQHSDHTDEPIGAATKATIFELK